MDDLIPRAAARKVVELMIVPPIVWIDAAHDIDIIPAVEAVPVVHGKWEEKAYEMDVYGQKVTTVTYYCTNCGAEHAYGRENYCPNCGAKMDGRKSDE